MSIRIKVFVFYDIEELILLDRLRLLKIVAENGHGIIMPEMRLHSYSYIKRIHIQEIMKKGLIKICDQKDCLTDFIEEHDSVYSYAGKSLLALIHFCKTEDAVLVIDDKDTLPCEIANEFSVSVLSLEEFYRRSIKDEKYYRFLVELRKEGEIKRA